MQNWTCIRDNLYRPSSKYTLAVGDAHKPRTGLLEERKKTTSRNSRTHHTTSDAPTLVASGSLEERWCRRPSGRHRRTPQRQRLAVGVVAAAKQATVVGDEEVSLAVSAAVPKKQFILRHVVPQLHHRHLNHASTPTTPRLPPLTRVAVPLILFLLRLPLPSLWALRYEVICFYPAIN